MYNYIEIGLVSPSILASGATLSRLDDEVILEFPNGKAYHWGTEYELFRSTVVWRTWTEYLVAVGNVKVKLAEICELDLDDPVFETHKFLYIARDVSVMDEIRFRLFSRKKSWRPAQFTLAFVHEDLEGDVLVDGWTVLFRTRRKVGLRCGPGHPWVVPLD